MELSVEIRFIDGAKVHLSHPPSAASPHLLHRQVRQEVFLYSSPVVLNLEGSIAEPLKYVIEHDSLERSESWNLERGRELLSETFTKRIGAMILHE